MKNHYTLLLTPLLVVLLQGCSLKECAPNGSCWPTSYTVTKTPRIIYVDSPSTLCHKALVRGGWEPYLEEKGILACTVGKNLSSPLLILPNSLSKNLEDSGWSVDLLHRYEYANAHGLVVYPNVKGVPRN